MWAWGGFGMILNGESRFTYDSQTFNSLIIEIHMCHFNDILLLCHGFRRNAEAMVLAGNF